MTTLLSYLSSKNPRKPLKTLFAVPQSVFSRRGGIRGDQTSCVRTERTRNKNHIVFEDKVGDVDNPMQISKPDLAVGRSTVSHGQTLKATKNATHCMFASVPLFPDKLRTADRSVRLRPLEQQRARGHVDPQSTLQPLQLHR